MNIIKFKLIKTKNMTTMNITKFKLIKTKNIIKKNIIKNIKIFQISKKQKKDF